MTERGGKRYLYDLEPQEVIKRLKSGSLLGFASDTNDPQLDRIVVSPNLMPFPIFKDLEKYLTIIVGQGYTLASDLEEFKKLDALTEKVVFEKVKNEEAM